MRRCGIPAMTLRSCDLEWGHDGDMHSSELDGFYADQHLDDHRRRQAIRARAAGSGQGQAMTAFDPALIERLVAEARERAAQIRTERYPSTDCERFCDLADQLDAAKAEVVRVTTERDNARWADATRKKAATVIIAERDALRAEVERMRPVIDAAGPMRDGHEGCVTDPPCSACFRCDFDRAVDAYRPQTSTKG